MRLRPGCGTLPWLAAALTIVGAGGRVFLPAQIAWPSYIFFGIVAALALLLAYFGWQCHVERQLPPPHLRKLLLDFSKQNHFSGTPAQFNQRAMQVLYGSDFAQYVAEPTDYYSLLVAQDFIQISSITDLGNKPDGTPDTVVNIWLSSKAEALIKNFPCDDSNPKI